MNRLPPPLSDLHRPQPPSAASAYVADQFPRVSSASMLHLPTALLNGAEEPVDETTKD